MWVRGIFVKITKLFIALILLFSSNFLFADEIKVNRGVNDEFPSEYTGLSETSNLFFAIGDLAEGVIIELYKPMLNSNDNGETKKSAQVVIVKRQKINKDSRGVELKLSPLGSDFFNIKEKDYLILNPRDEASLTDKFVDIPMPKDNLFGDSTIYMLEEAKENPPASEPVDMSKLIDEYEGKDKPEEEPKKDVGPPIDMSKMVDEYEGKNKYAKGTLMAKAHYIQIGVFKDTFVLETNVGKLAKHMPVVVIPFRNGGVLKYRLLVGNFRPDELGVASQILRSLGYKQFFLKSTEEFLKADTAIERSGPKSAPVPEPVSIPGIESDDEYEPIDTIPMEEKEESIPAIEGTTPVKEESLPAIESPDIEDSDDDKPTSSVEEYPRLDEAIPSSDDPSSPNIAAK